jgi:diguanylate cyclase (GGDEF)-like protein
MKLNWETWKHLLHPEDQARVTVLTEQHILAAGESMEMEYRIRHKDGDWRWWLDRVTQSATESGDLKMTGLVQDITERKLAEQRLEFLVQHDELTGLLNRRGISDVARHQFAQARRGGLPCCFAIADLDHFKRVNDSFGHDVGDQVLEHVAECLRQSVRAGDWVGRWGGEEFLLVLTQTPLDEGREALERVRQAVEDSSIEVDGKALCMTISIGVAAAEPEDAEPDAVIARADARLYQAKRGGRNQVCSI